MPAATDRAEAHLQKHGREELPLAQGQGRRPRVSGCDGTGVAWRSYPTSEVRGGGPDELPHARGQGRRPRGATSRRRSEETPRGATTHRRSGRRRRGATPSPRSGGCAGPGSSVGVTPTPLTPTHGSAVCGPQLLRFPVIQDHGPDTHQRPILGYVHLC